MRLREYDTAVLPPSKRPNITWQNVVRFVVTFSMIFFFLQTNFCDHLLSSALVSGFACCFHYCLNLDILNPAR